jgi:hypothetical protein
MRALCGAIIAAGALIGLGLAAIGHGLRYERYPYLNDELKAQWVEFKHIDSPLMIAMFVLIVTLLIGLGIAFFGLAYHHQRRHHEWLREHGRHAGEHATRP